MYELVQLAERTFIIDNPVKVGLYLLDNNEVCLIDSGLDKEVGRKIKKILDAQNWSLKTIYNTHSHGDHVGGNNFLQAETNCKIYAPSVECAFVNNPILEPSFLFGAFPFEELKNKFLYAQKSIAEELDIENLPHGLEAFPLGGHFYNMHGFRTSDDIVFLADALMSNETIEKYKMGFIYDVESYFETLEKLENMHAKLFVPAHAKISENIVDLVQHNRACALDMIEQIKKNCTIATNYEHIVQKLFYHYNVKMDLNQYMLVASCVRSILSWLKSKKEVEIIIDDNLLLWKKC